jgi:6-phosphogluconolactonase
VYAELQPRPGLNIYADAHEIAVAAAELCCRLSAGAVRAHGFFSVALSGGSTPRALFALLAEPPYRERIDWSAWQVFWSDERAVPPEDPESNFGMARSALLSRVPLPEANVHRMAAERAPLEGAAAGYEDEIRAALGAPPRTPPVFDLVMLGMGDDGHTASLFPESSALDEPGHLVAATYVARHSAHRLTFTPLLINNASNVLMLIAGAAKAGALAAVLEGPFQPQRYPAQLVRPEPGVVYRLVDRAAAAGLGRE